MNVSLFLAAPVLVLLVVLLLGFTGCELPTQGTGPNPILYYYLITGTPGLVAYYRLGEPDGSTYAYDSSAVVGSGVYWPQQQPQPLASFDPTDPVSQTPSGWPATSPEAGGTIHLGQPGLLSGDPDATSMQVDGGWVSVVHDDAMNPPADPGFTIEAYVVPEWDEPEPDVERAVITSLDTSTGITGFALLKNSEDRWAARIGTGDESGPYVAASSTTIQFHSPVHLCATYDGNVLTLYVDGTQAGTVTPPDPYVPNASARLYIGIRDAAATGNYYPFKGRMQEVAIYNRPLTLDEIQQRWWSANFTW